MQDAPTWVWIVFAGTAGVLLAIDLLAHSGGEKESHRAAVAWSVVWIAAGLAFAGFVWYVFDAETAQEYLAAYLIEKSLSLDNLFVFLIVFSMLRIPKRLQRTGLSWGIFGALFFRAVFIFLGTAALRRWEWVEYIFAAILLAAAWHAAREHPEQQSENRAVEWLSRRLPVSRRADTSHFFVREDSKRKVTPLLVAVLAIEATDIVFAIDSVPAALAVSRNEFVVYSSNAFAILGLRALYIVLAGMIRQLRYLHWGLAGVLAFAGFKMAAHKWVELPPLISVAIIFAIIAVPVVFSIRANRRERGAGDRAA